MKNLSDQWEDNPAEINYLEVFKVNLENGIEFILEISEGLAYPNENLKSIPEFVKSTTGKIKIYLLT